jgi:hypothetical protein
MPEDPEDPEAAGPRAGDEAIDESDDLDGADESSGHTKAPRKRRLARRLFPALSFGEALSLANAIQEHGSGQPIRRLTLFEALDRSPDSGSTRKLITSSAQYGITNGGYSAEVLSLTPLGTTASDPNAAPGTKLAARAELAITGIAPFKAIYEQYKGSRVPAIEVLRDAARATGVPEDEVAECVETFLANARELSLIRNIGGSEHLISIEQAVEEASAESDQSALLQDVAPKLYDGNVEVVHRLERPTARPSTSPTASDSLVAATADLADTCFIISPIGATDSTERKHADLVLSALIEPALLQLGLTPVRADKISKPGMITGQVIDHLSRAKLVIADLSFGNPNVYYELALRHATRKAVVQIIRTSDRLPFDVGQFRTVTIDMTDIFTFVPQLDLHRQEITRQCRAALEEGSTAESPLSLFYPQFWNKISK